MKRIFLAGLALAFLSFAFTMSAQEPGPPMGPDPAPIVSEETMDQALPAQANKNLRSKATESAGDLFLGFLWVAIPAALLVGLILHALHSHRRSDRGEYGIKRPNIPYGGAPPKKT